MIAAQVGLISLSYAVLMLLKSAQENGTPLSLLKTVNTENGAVRGRLYETLMEKKPYHAFKGIPYAKPPIGELRFKPPKPADSWAPRVLDAFEFGIPCMIFKDEYERNKPMGEDCLFINVFVPVVKTKSKLAVMLHIVGGGFREHSANEKLSMPDFLLEHDIIVVTFNYRLGAFGFMSLDTPEYPGNMGMKDQQMAIKWVYKNIEYFGGDKTKITLSGHSSGGISVSYHVINDESRKYFQRVIPMSGNALNHHAHHTGNHKCLMYAIAKNASQSIDDIKQLIDFLKRTPALQIQNFINENVELPFPLFWAPVIERKDAIEPFLTDDPVKLYKNIQFMNLTSLITFTNREALFYETSDSLQPELVKRHIDQLEFELPIYGFNSTYAKRSYLRPTLSKVKNHFLNGLTNASTQAEIADKYEIMKSYFEFGYSIVKMTQFHVKKSIQPTYLIRFSVHDGMELIYGPFDNRRSVRGAGHAEDLCYLFLCHMMFPIYEVSVKTKDVNPKSAIFMNTVLYMSTTVSNFVKHGNPGAGSDPVRENELNYLDVSSDGLSLGQLSNDQINFMDSIIGDAEQLMAQNEREPPEPEFDIACRKLQMRKSKSIHIT